jgi:hypothetical protein
MNAVEIIEITPAGFWFTWAFGRNIGCYTPERNVELDVEGRPSMSFRHTIVAALRRVT